IGAILTPQLTGEKSDLPYASTLCGACYQVCPVKIDIPSILVELRAREVELSGAAPDTADRVWQAAMKAASYAMADGGRFRRAARLPRALRAIARHGVIRRLPFPGSRWTRSRDLPEPPRQTFHDWWAARERRAGTRQEGER